MIHSLRTGQVSVDVEGQSRDAQHTGRDGRHPGADVEVGLHRFDGRDDRFPLRGGVRKFAVAHFDVAEFDAHSADQTPGESWP